MRETIEAETAEDLKIFNYNFRKQVLKKPRQHECE